MTSKQNQGGVPKKVYDSIIKMLLIGDSAVGKTSILFRYSEDSFSTTFVNTIGIDFKIKTIVIDGRKIKLQIWDTAGQERFHTVTTSYYRIAKGILLVYDVTNQRSFKSVTRWLASIEIHAPADVERILLGNKCDWETKRVVPKETGEALAHNQGITFLETSAKTNYNINEAFETLARQILAKTPIKKEDTDILDLSKLSGDGAENNGLSKCCHKSTS